MSQRAPDFPQTPEEWEAWEAEVRQSLDNWRDGILKRLGYGDYESYRRNPLWRKIRARVLKQYDGKCFRCDGAASQVHHRTYTEAVLKGEDDEQLRPLCDGCHHFVEFDDDNRMRTDTEKERVLFEKDTRIEYPRPRVGKRGQASPEPPEWKRMNAWQRQGWRNELQWLVLTHERPNLASAHPTLYESLKSAYESTKQNGIEVLTLAQDRESRTGTARRVKK